MLDVLEQALAWGSRSRPTGSRGQGSIFDLGDAAEAKRRAPSADPARGVREARAAAAREGDARPLRLGAPAAGDPRPAAAQDRLHARRARAAPRRRDRHRRRDRLRGQAADDEEGRPDGLPPARRPRRAAPRCVVFNSVYAAARELCVADRVLVVKGRVDHKQEGETKLIALEVSAFEAMPERQRGAADGRRAPGARRRRPRARRARARTSRARRRCCSRSRPRTVRRMLALGPDYRVQPVAGLLRRGEGAARRGRDRVTPWRAIRLRRRVGRATRPREDVYDALVDGTNVSRLWWKPVYITRRGRRASSPVQHFKRQASVPRCKMRARGRLEQPSARTICTVAVDGDLRGTGVWTLSANARRLDPRALGTGPCFADRAAPSRTSRPFLRPALPWNHTWAVARAREGLEP